MPGTQPTYLRLAIPTPLRRVFDYLPPRSLAGQTLQPGLRVKVPFGRQTLVGILLEVVHHTDVPQNKLKRASAILDPQPLLDKEMLTLLHWVSRYYHHPIGEVFSLALPVKLRQGQSASVQGITHWAITATGQAVDCQSLHRAPKQAAVLRYLQNNPAGQHQQQLSEAFPQASSVLQRLTAKGWVTSTTQSSLPLGQGNRQAAPPLNTYQQVAVNAVTEALHGYQPFVLEGITGSGKTEVYLNIIEAVIRQGQQALVLVPEIGLTPQLLQRFLVRLPGHIAVLHSGLNDEERLQAWLAAQSGEAQVVIGTRSAVFTPLPRAGVIIVDEEHDLSYKQQDGLRYSARDLAVMRARELTIPVVLGSATPSLESLYNVQQQRYRQLLLPERAGDAQLPRVNLVDVRSQSLQHGLSAQLLSSMRSHLNNQAQVLLFLNRRGFAPVVMCHDCGWHAVCPRCDAHLTLHQRQHRLRCHHCGTEQRLPESCPSCHSSELLQVGYGTERIEQSLAELFPDFQIIRIDRDSTRRKGEMQKLLEQIHDGHGQILIGTQMLAKGHDFPNVTLAAILNADYGLYSADFRAAERMGQLILQVAGRAGRAARAGEVLIQTHHPDHPLFSPLLAHDYPRFAQLLLAERQQTELPPYTHLTLLRAEATAQAAPIAFLEEARQLAERYQLQDVLLMGPFPAPMERRAGRFRAQFLLQSSQRQQLHQLLDAWLPQLESLKSAKQVRWSIDVDPLETF